MAEDIEHQDIQTQDSPSQASRPQEQPSDQEQPTHSMPQDEDGDNIDAQHLRELLAALKVDGTWFKKHIPVFLLVFGMLVLYVTNSYQAQQEILKEEELNDSVKDCKYRCLTREGELTRRTRQSQLEKQLRDRGDSTLLPSKEPPFLLMDE